MSRSLNVIFMYESCMKAIPTFLQDPCPRPLQVISESTSISSVIRRLLHGGRKWRDVDFENQAWYTDPIDFLWPSSPSQRLYKRQGSLHDVSGINLSNIFEESESEHDEGFYGVGEEHQSAALNVIAMLFGSDVKKKSPFRPLCIKDEAEDSCMELPMQLHAEEDNNNEKNVESAEESDEKETEESCPSLQDLLTGCQACSQLQQHEMNSKIGASHTVNAAFMPATRQRQQQQDPTAGTSWDPPDCAVGEPLYRRRSSGKVAENSNAPCIPASSENEVLDDRPDSCDISLQGLFQDASSSSGSLPPCAVPSEYAPRTVEHLSTLSLNQSSIASVSSSSSSLSSSTASAPSMFHLFHSHSNPYTFTSNANTSVNINATGSCLNSINSDYSVFSTQTLPVVVVASGRDLGISSETENSDHERAMPKATFHWTLDDSNCQEDAGESLLSPLAAESSLEEAENSQSTPATACRQHTQSNVRKKLVFSHDDDEFADDYVSLENEQTLEVAEGAVGGGESLISPLTQHLLLEEERRRGASVSSDDGEGKDLIPADPHIDSAELRLNLDFILDNSTDEEAEGVGSSDVSIGQESSQQISLNEAPSDLDQEVFEDLEDDLQLNLDFIDEDEEHPGDLSLEDVFLSNVLEADVVPQIDSGNGSCALTERTANELQQQGSNVRRNDCDNLANLELYSSNESNSNSISNAVGPRENLLRLLQGDFGIWLQSVAEQSPRHFWPAHLNQEMEATTSSFSCLPREGNDIHPIWGSGTASSLVMNLASPWSSIWLPISPRRDVDNENIGRPTSRLWDVNLQKWSESPRERCPTLENIQPYFVNLR